MSDKKYPSDLYLESAATNIDFAKQVSVEAVVVMAKELLALRKAISVTLFMKQRLTASCRPLPNLITNSVKITESEPDS